MAPDSDRKDSWLRRHGDLIQRFAAVAGLVLLLVAFSLINENFRTVDNLLTVALQSCSIALLGIGVTYVIITGGIDLSVGSLLALAGVAAGLSIKAGLPVWAGFGVGLAAGIAAGAVNGALVNWVRLPPFIATLGMMMIASGFALQLTGAQSISDFPAAFGDLGNGALFASDSFRGIPYPVVVVVVLAVVFAYLLKRTRLGRYLYAIGSNEEAARLSGIRVARIKMCAYMISGGFAGLAGLVIMSRLVTVQPNAGLGYEMYAIAAAVIGGTSLMGGIGTISGTIIGALIIGVLRNGLNMCGVKEFIQMIIIGAVIIFAVAVDRLRHREGGTSGSAPAGAGVPPPRHTGRIVAAVVAAIAVVALAVWGLTRSAESARPGEVEIAVIVKTANSSFWQHVAVGARDAEKELRATGAAIRITFAGPDSETRLEEQVNLVDNAVNRRVGAIVLSPGDPDALMPPARAAKAAGIPLIIIDSALTDKSLYTAFLATDNRAAGQLCARELIKRLGPDQAGKVAIMSYVAGVGSEIDRVGGFKDALAQDSKLTVVGPFYSQSDMIKALDQTTDVLTSNPDLLGIFGANEPTAVGMGRAVAAARMGGKLVAIGFDGDKNLQNFIRDGTLQGIAVQSPYNMGYLGVKTAYAAIQKEKIEEFVDTGIVFVTKENVDSPEAQKVLY